MKNIIKLFLIMISFSLYAAESSSSKKGLGLKPDITNFKAHDGIITSVKISPDSKLIASSSADGSIKIWDIETKELYTAFEQPGAYVSSISWSPDGTKIAAVYRSGALRIFDVITNALIDHEGIGVVSIPTSVSWSPSADAIAVATGENILWYHWDRNLKIINVKKLEGDAHFVLWMNIGGCFHPLSIGGEHLNLWNYSGSIKSLNFLDNLLTEFAVSDKYIVIARKRADNNAIVLLGHDFKKINQIDVEDAITSMAVWQRNAFISSDARGKIIARGNDILFLVTGDVVGDIVIRNLNENKVVSIYHAHNMPITDIDWSSDGKYIVAGSSDKTLTIWKDPLKGSAEFTDLSSSLQGLQNLQELFLGNNHLDFNFINEVPG